MSDIRPDFLEALKGKTQGDFITIEEQGQTLFVLLADLKQSATPKLEDVHNQIKSKLQSEQEKRFNDEFINGLKQSAKIRNSLINEKSLETLEKYGIAPSKSRVRILIDNNLLDAMCRSMAIKPGETILEVGPGAGVLTEMLNQGGIVHAVEFDFAIQRYLSENLDKNFTLHKVPVNRLQ